METISPQNQNEGELNVEHDNEESNQPSLQNQIKVNREKTPYKDFVNNDKLIYSSFSFLFLFGRGLRRSATVDTNTSRQLMLQFNAKFDTCHRFIFLLFNQMQRHVASRVVTSRVQCKSFDKFVEMINEPNFVTKLAKCSSWSKLFGSYKL